MRMIAALTMFSACGGAPSPPRPTPANATSSGAGDAACHAEERPLGSSSDYQAPVIDGFTISPPELCPAQHDGAYIKIERTHGARTLGIARQPGGGFGEGCMKAPPDPSDASQCPILNWGVPILAVQAEMDRRHILVNGIGGGPCADVQGDFAAWHMSIGVHSWSEAEQVLRWVAAEMDRYDVRGYVGVAVKGIPCAVLL